MATRTRAKRGERGPSEPAPEQVPAQAQARRSTRSTRQTANQDISSDAGSSPSEALAPRKNKPDEAASVRAKASLATWPAARRGARFPGPPPSVASIATHPPRADDASDESDEDDDDDDDEEEEEEEDDGPGHGAAAEYQDEVGDSEASEDNDEDPAAAEAQRQVMILSCMDLANASKDLMKRLQNPDHENLVFQGILRMKRNAFFTVRQIYESSASSPFVEWGWLNSLLQQPTAEASRALKTVLVFSNLVTALELIERVKTKDIDDPLSVLEKLDDVFPKLFTLPGKDNQYPDLALEIRTIRWIETLAATKSSVDPRKVAVTVFCEPTDEKSYSTLFATGPYRALGGLRGESLIDVCSERIKTLFLVIKEKDSAKIRTPLPITELRAAFPLSNLLVSLREWLLSVYSKSASRLEQVEKSWKSLQFDGDVVDDADVLYAEDDIAESVVESAVESQPIVRIADMDPPSSTLFQNADSIRQLYKGLSSNQKQGSPFPGAPLRQASPDPGNPLADWDNDDDDDEEFETDTRPVDKGKRPALAASLPPAKRQRFAAAPPSSTARTDMPPPPLPNRFVSSSSHRHQEPPTRRPPPPPSSSRPPDFSAIQREKTIVLQNARHAQPITYKQRHVWTERDSEVLTDLVGRRRAAWAVIHREDSHLFEMPRNPQAYRDRARNIKVDFLLTNQVLPPGFDLVTLGKKEVDRLIQFGKNPTRREDDVDEDGKPINTNVRTIEE